MTGNATRKTVTKFCTLLLILLAAIAALALTHLSSTQIFNRTDRVFRGEDNDVMQVAVEQKGSWPKEDSLAEGVKGGGQYDITVSNLSEYEISDWTLRLNINTTCYLNQDWNGTVEIHQGVRSDHPVTQTLDLHDFSFAFRDVELEFVGFDKNNLMIRLYPGDYIIYHPKTDNTVKEEPLNPFNGTPGSTTVGMIFYYNSSVDLSDFEVVYHFNRSFFSGAMFWILCALAGVWTVLLIGFGVWVVVRRKAERELCEREEMLEETLDLVSRFVDAKDPYTNGHSERVSRYAMKLAEKLGLSERDARYAYYAGILHDVGKSYVPDEILKKPGRLNDEEYERIKSHTVFGGEMLRSIRSVPGVGDGALYHHERYDGRGYPTGLAGENIPLLARLICVADAFDAMNSTRCYRSNLTKEKILSELEDNKGKQFDPAIAEAMIELVQSGAVEAGAPALPAAGETPAIGQ